MDKSAGVGHNFIYIGPFGVNGGKKCILAGDKTEFELQKVLFVFFLPKFHFIGFFAQNRQMTNLSWISALKEIFNNTMSFDCCPDWNGVWNHEIVSVPQMKPVEICLRKNYTCPQYLLYTLSKVRGHFELGTDTIRWLHLAIHLDQCYPFLVIIANNWTDFFMKQRPCGNRGYNMETPVTPWREKDIERSNLLIQLMWSSHILRLWKLKL